MAGQIDLDIDQIQDDEHGLYDFEPGDGYHICERRSGEPVHIDGQYLTTDDEARETVLVTTINDTGDVEIIDAETMELHYTISNDEIEGSMISADVLDEYGLVALKLLN